MKDISLRKYSQSLGEPVDFDFDGTLRDRKLTLKSARDVASYDARVSCYSPRGSY